MSRQVHKLQISRALLTKALQSAIAEQTVGMAGLDCVGMNAVLIDTKPINGVMPTFPLDTIEVELARPVRELPRKMGKLRLASADGVTV